MTPLRARPTKQRKPKDRIEIDATVDQISFTAHLFRKTGEGGSHNNIVLNVKNGKLSADWAIYKELTPESMRLLGQVWIAVADEADRRLAVINKHKKPKTV